MLAGDSYSKVYDSWFAWFKMVFHPCANSLQHWLQVEGSPFPPVCYSQHPTTARGNSMFHSSSVPMMVLIMAGGRGTRFWPLSRRRLPKQCISLTSSRTLIQSTVDRLDGLVPPENILIATGNEMAPRIREQLPQIPGQNFLVEPRGRNTAPCIAWGAVEIGRRMGGETVMAVLPADHLVKDEHLFRSSLSAAAQAASETNALVTLGISPTKPETGYGYLSVGGELGHWGGMPFHRVRKFIEKPDLNTATHYLENGGYLWNSGMFCWTVDAIRDAYREHLPSTWAAMAELTFEPNKLEELWSRFEATSVDYGVMERSPGVLTMPASFGWSDVGAWTALPDVVKQVDGGWILSHRSVSRNSHQNIVHVPEKLVALLGVNKLIVVDTPDVLMVASQNAAQDIGEILEELQQRNLEEYL